MAAARDTKTSMSLARALLTAGVPFGVLMGFYLGLQHGLSAGLAAGPVMGLCFGGALWLLARSKAVQSQTEAELSEGETILREGAANHVGGANASGGRLYLTNSRLHFKPHKLNLRARETSIALDQILEAKPVNTLGLVPNGLLVSCRDKNTYRFVVSGRKQWLAELRDAAELAES